MNFKNIDEGIIIIIIIIIIIMITITITTTLVIYDVTHSFPLGVGRDFPFTEDGNQRHFWYLSGTSRD